LDFGFAILDSGNQSRRKSKSKIRRLHMYPTPEGDDIEALFIEVDGTPLLEPCSKGEQAYTGRVEIIFEPTCHLLPDNQSFGGGARAMRFAESLTKHSPSLSKGPVRATLETAELEIGAEVDIGPQGER
jgi:hypothetical protein